MTPEATPSALPDAGPNTCVLSPVAAPFPTGACAVARPATRDALDDALAAIGHDRCTLHQDLDDVSVGLMKPRDRRALIGFGDLLEFPLRLPGWGAETARFMDESLTSASPVAHALAAAATRLGGPIVECPDPALFAESNPADTAPLATSIADLEESFGKTADRAALAAAVAGVPIELQRALARIVRVQAWAYDEVVAARGRATGKALDSAAELVAGVGLIPLDAALLDKIDSFDLPRVVRAASVVSTAIEGAGLERFAGVDIPPLDLETSIGAVVLRGPHADEYAAESRAKDAMLVFDTGGDDTYLVSIASGTKSLPIAVAIDLGGRDLYAYVERPTASDAVGKRLPSDEAGRDVYGRTRSRVGRQGAGIMGVGLLYDFGQEGDTYRSLAYSQGVGVFGVGVLFDEGGDDTYEAEVLAQGAAGWGVGLLLDRAGSDRHLAYTAAQGYGFTRGIGALVDADGDDVYEADPGDSSLGGDPIYPSAQLPNGGNTSMAQGCGRGVRPDLLPSHIGLPGGLGLLRDLRGSDRYAAGVFAQAASFAMGVGLLLDGEGDDTYEGLWYVQGAAAHTGLTLFVDGKGNDRYNPTFPIASTSIGVGHDFSVGIHVDEGGDDHYRAPNLSLGSGYANGVGIVVNAGGTDAFEASGELMLGSASATEVLSSAARKKMPTVGVFVKAGGGATYDAPVRGPGAGATWSTTPNKASGANEQAVGVDRPQGSASID